MGTDQPPRNIKILVVDDDATNRKLLCALLQAEGFSIREAADGIEALAALDREPADLVITDLLMPRLDGYRLCIEIRERAIPAHVLVYSASFRQPADEKLAMECGANRFLAKPVPDDALIAAVGEVLREPMSATAHAPPPAEREVMQEYSTRLVNKIEQRNAELAESEERMAGIIASAMDAIVSVDSEQRVVVFNPAAEKMFGYRAAEVLGQPLDRFIPQRSRPLHRQHLEDFSRTGVSARAMQSLGEISGVRANGEEFPIEASISQIGAGGRKIFTAILRDVTERRRAEMLLAGQNRVLETIAAGAPLAETLDTLVRLVESLAEGMLCSILLLDEDGTHVHHGAAPSLPAAFNQAIDGAAIGPLAGSCGTAAWRGEQVIVRDIQADPLWADYRALADAHGLRACWSTPIFSSERKVLGTFAMYYHEPRDPRASELRLIEASTHLAGIAIERTRAAAALRASEARTRSIFEQASVGIYIITAENRYLDANARGLELLGYSREELLKMSVADVLAPHEVARMTPESSPMRPGEHHLAEWDHVRKDGTMIPCEVSARRLDDRSFLAIVRDLTERKQAEHERREIFERITDAFVALDAIWRYTYVNGRAAQIFGRRAEDLIGKNMWEEFPEGVGQDFHRAYERAMAEQQPAFLEEYYPPYDRWFENRIYPSPEGLTVYFHDITERKRTEQALRESEERLRLALDAAHMGTFDWDLPGNRITWSRWHEELWGFKPGEFGGTYEAFSERVHPDDVPEIDAEVARCIAARARFSREFRVVWPDGSVHWIMGSGEFEFGAEGRPVRMRGVVKEISDRKCTEQALRNLSWRLLNAEDEERRRIAKELHDSTAQDLVAVVLNLDQLQDALPDEHAAALLADSRGLIENCANDIRTLSYLLHPPRLDEAGLPGGLTEYAAGFSNRTDIRVHVEAAPHFGRLPEDMEIALFRVAQESLANIRRHSESDTATIRLAKMEGNAVLEIVDQGRGFPPELASQPGARGVGIVGMRERLQHLGGHLEIKSGSGGTTVRAVLPWKGERK